MWRLDILLSKKKYNSISYVDNGGWHFTNIKSAEEIEKKLLNYTHHHEFEESKITLSQLKEKIKNKKAIYDLSVDSKKYKWNSEKLLKAIEISKMPDYIKENPDKYSEWLDF